MAELDQQNAVSRRDPRPIPTYKALRSVVSWVKVLGVLIVPGLPFGGHYYATSYLHSEDVGAFVLFFGWLVSVPVGYLTYACGDLVDAIADIAENTRAIAERLL